MTRSWKSWTALILILLGVGAGLFQSGLENPFIFDDVAKIRDNPDLHLGEFSIHNFLHDYTDKRTHLRNDPSRPLTFFTYWVLWHWGDGDVVPFHVASIFLHILNALLVGLIVREISRRLFQTESLLPVFAASLLFVSLPLNAGTVIYAYGLSDVLSSFLCLLMTHRVLRKDKAGPGHWLAALVIYAAAVFSKQSALVMPAVLVVIDVWTRGFSETRKRWWGHALLFSFAAAYVLWRSLYFGRLGDLEAHSTYQVHIYAPLQGIMIWKYVAWIFWPAKLSIDHGVTPQMFEYWQCWLGWSAIGVVTLGTTWAAFRSVTGKILSLGWLFFLLTLTPTSSFFPTTDLLVERRAYLPSAGFVLILGGLLAVLIQKYSHRKIFQAAAALSLAAFFSVNSWISVDRVQIYGDEEKLWSQVKELYPRNEKARINLSTFYLSRQNFPAAEKELLGILEMYPDYYGALSNLGALYQHPRNPRRDPFKAIQYYQRVLVQEPEDLPVLSNLGILLLDLQRPADAIAPFEKLVQLNPNIVQARLGLATALMRTNQKEKALLQAQAALQIDPGNANARKIVDFLLSPSVNPQR